MEFSLSATVTSKKSVKSGQDGSIHLLCSPLYGNKGALIAAMFSADNASQFRHTVADALIVAYSACKRVGADFGNWMDTAVVDVKTGSGDATRIPISDINGQHYLVGPGLIDDAERVFSSAKAMLAQEAKAGVAETCEG